MQPAMTSGAMIVKNGDTLDAILLSAGIDGTDRAAAVLALTGAYDLAELKPGHQIAWATRPEALRACVLTVDIDHGSSAITRCAHLPAIADAMQPGQRLKAGDPVDPMDRDALPEQELASARDLTTLAEWRKVTGFQDNDQSKEG